VTDSAPRPRTLPRLAVGALLVAAGVTAALLAPDAVRGLAGRLRDPGAAGVALLCAVYVAGTILLVPAPLMHLTTGFALGPALGAAVALPASVVGSCAAFWIGRGLARGPVSRLAGRMPAVAGLERAVSGSGFRLVLLLRLSQVAPFTVLNYVLGSSGLRFRDFALASAVGTVPSLVIQVWAGSLVADAGDLLEAGRAGGAGALLLAAIGAGAVAIGVGTLLRRALRARSPALPAGQ
jgi:uncharacterized membrane protein YdjX (TVP38/TMEM64 family)